METNNIIVNTIEQQNEAFNFLTRMGAISKYKNTFQLSENFDVLVCTHKDSKKHYEILVQSNIIIPTHLENNKVIPTVINYSNIYFSRNEKLY